MDSGLCVSLCLYLILFISAVSTSCPTEINNTVDISSGSINNDIITYKNIDFTSDIYFYYQNRTYGCVCDIKTCLPKCCGEGQIIFDRDCIDSDKEFDITLYIETEASNLSMNNFYLLPTSLKGDSILRVTEEYFIEEDGHLHTSFKTFTDPTTYCFEGDENSDLIIYVYLEEDTDEDIMITTRLGRVSILFYMLSLQVKVKEFLLCKCTARTKCPNDVTALRGLASFGLRTFCSDSLYLVYCCTITVKVNFIQL